MLFLRSLISVHGNCMLPDPWILRKLDLELYIPCPIWVFRGTPFRCIASRVVPLETPPYQWEWKYLSQIQVSPVSTITFKATISLLVINNTKNTVLQIYSYSRIQVWFEEAIVQFQHRQGNSAITIIIIIIIIIIIMAEKWQFLCVWQPQMREMKMV